MARHGKASGKVASTLKGLNIHIGSRSSVKINPTKNTYSVLSEDGGASELGVGALNDEEDVEPVALISAGKPPSKLVEGVVEPFEVGEKDNQVPWTFVDSQRNKNRLSYYASGAPAKIDVREMRNWRERPDGIMNSGYHAPRLPEPRNDHGMMTRSKMRHRPGPRTIGGILMEDIMPGTIMWRYDVRPCKDPNVKDKDKGLFFGPDGEKWHRKGRYWLVVFRCRDHVMELPIYTFGNTGLAKKPQQLKDTYNSVKPPNATDFVNHSPNQLVLEIEEAENGNETFRNSMVVHINEIMSHNNDVFNLRLVGRLTQRSTDEIIRRVKEVIGTYLDD